jgi:hypothetical protein
MGNNNLWIIYLFNLRISFICWFGGKFLIIYQYFKKWKNILVHGISLLSSWFLGYKRLRLVLGKIYMDREILINICTSYPQVKQAYIYKIYKLENKLYKISILEFFNSSVKHLEWVEYILWAFAYYGE